MAAKKSKLSPDQQKMIFLIALVAVGVIYVYFSFILAPLRKKSEELKTQLTTAKAEVQKLEISVGQLPHFKREQERLLDSVAMWKERMPDDDQLPLVIETLSNYARQSGIKILIIVPHLDSADSKESGKGSGSKDASSAKDIAYKAIPLQIDAEGGYHALGTFINRIEQARNPMHVLSLRVSDTPEKPYAHGIQMLIQAYFGVRKSGFEGES